MSDTITVTTGTTGVAGNIVSDLQTYFAAKLLEVAELYLVLDQFADKVPIPSNSSKTIRFNRIEKLSVSAAPSQLTEGVAPDADGLTMNQFEATAEQYGRLVRISDLSELTAKHDIVAKAIYVLGLNAAEIYDQLVFNVLDAATSVYRPAGAATDLALKGDSYITYNDAIAVNALMLDNGAKPLKNGLYVMVICPQVKATIQKDPDWKASNQFKAPEKIWRGEVGELAGFSWVVSNAPGFAATTTTASGSANKVYSGFAIGQFAYQISDLQNLRVYVVGPGGHSDPLQQSRKIGFKFAFKSLISNQNWIYRLRSAGLNSVTN